MNWATHSKTDVKTGLDCETTARKSEVLTWVAVGLCAAGCAVGCIGTATNVKAVLFAGPVLAAIGAIIRFKSQRGPVVKQAR